MKKEWNSVVLEIISLKNEDVIRTSGDDYEGEIDWD